MKNTLTIISLFLVINTISFNISAQDEAIQKGLEAINTESIKAQLEFLSSDWMEGRATTEKGEFLAADYLASMLQFIGIDPAGDKEWTQPTRKQRWSGIRSEEYTSYFQNIYFTKELESNASLSIYNSENSSINFSKGVDFDIYGKPYNMQAKAQVVFVGYGFTDKESGYDDYKGVDVKGKIIIRLEGYPGHLDTNSLGYKKFTKEQRYFYYYLNREKNKIAKEKGALAVININESIDLKYWIDKPEFMEKDYNESAWSPIYEHELYLPSDTLENSPMSIYPTKKIINKIFENQDIDIKEFEKQVANSLKPKSKKLKNINIGITYEAKTKLALGRNVLGVIKGEKKDEIVVIGGHYDHLGIKDGQIWNGADDNASGTVGVWMLAKAFKASGIKPKRTIVFAAWTGEEVGLYGSEYFTEHPYGDDINNIKFYLNFDMISKDDDTDTLKNQATLTYTSSLENMEEKTENNISDYDLNLDLNYRSSEKPRGGSDHTSFSSKNIPIMYFDAGFPITYHTPEDETSDINWEKMRDIIKISFINLWDIVNKE